MLILFKPSSLSLWMLPIVEAALSSNAGDGSCCKSVSKEADTVAIAAAMVFSLIQQIVIITTE